MKNLRSCKGAITLYILVSILFFMIIIVNVYSNLRSKEDRLESEYQKIKESYEQNANEVYSLTAEESTIEGLIKSGKAVTEKKTLSDKNNDTIVIPKGFSIAKDSDKTIKNGIVVVAPDKSEFVWVPVKDVNTMYGINSTGKKVGKLYKFNESGYYENNWVETDGIMSWTNSNSCREPDYLSSVIDGDAVTENTSKGVELLKSIVGLNETDGDILTQWSTKLQIEFDEMIQSVSKYGGFYIGRYETSLKINENGTTKIAQSIRGAKSATAESTSANTWYGLYQVEKMYSEDNKLTDIVGSSMIWGSQYDQMMIWMQSNNIDVSSVTPITGAVGNTDPDKKTGIVETDKLNNIYDLLGNSREWTIEADSDMCRCRRGGGNDKPNSPSYRGSNIPNWVKNLYSSRITLYVK